MKPSKLDLKEIRKNNQRTVDRFLNNYVKKVYVLVNHPDIETSYVVMAFTTKTKLKQWAKEHRYALDLTREYFDYNEIVEVKLK